MSDSPTLRTGAIEIDCPSLKCGKPPAGTYCDPHRRLNRNRLCQVRINAAMRISRDKNRARRAGRAV